MNYRPDKYSEKGWRINCPIYPETVWYNKYMPEDGSLLCNLTRDEQDWFYDFCEASEKKMTEQEFIQYFFSFVRFPSLYSEYLGWHEWIHTLEGSERFIFYQLVQLSEDI